MSYFGRHLNIFCADPVESWIPAFAGMTERGGFSHPPLAGEDDAGGGCWWFAGHPNLSMPRVRFRRSGSDHPSPSSRP